MPPSGSSDAPGTSYLPDSPLLHRRRTTRCVPTWWGHASDMDLGAVRRDLALQDGVVCRRQLMAGGCTPADLERMLRRRELSRLLPGVFVDHTGVPTWNQRAWAGVLFYRPAALVGDSAVRAASAPAFERHPSKAVHIGIDSDRRLVPVPGYTVTRLSRFDDRVLTNTSPPRQRLEDALLDLAGGH